MNYSRKDFLQASLLSSAGLLQGVNVFGSEAARRQPRPRSRAKDETGCSISIFSKHLQWLDYGEMAKVAADIGFDGVDLTVRPGGHVLPEHVERDLPAAVKAVRDEGLEVYMITTTIGDPDEEYAESILKTASQLGIGHYRTDWFSYDDSISVPENLEHFSSKLQRLAAMNSEYDIQGDYQNHAGTSFGSPIWDLWIVLNELDTQWIGCQYDIRHATVEGANTWQNGLGAIHPHIGTLDIKDFQWVQSEDGWREQNVPLGEGMVNFQQYLKLLQKYQVQVQVPISLHYEYELGGAERGAEIVETDKKDILEAFRRDLKILDGWLSEAGLN
ncbi:MAG TPA: TIM barrel protein [Fodinibius sp.]|nr:TIM barrel protein [Fodinibius sp.]